MQNPSAANCDREIMAILQSVLGDVNPFAASYKYMKVVEEQENASALQENRPVSRVTMRMVEGHDNRRYNAPLHEQVSIVFTGEDGAPPANRVIVVYPHNEPLQRLPLTSSNIDPMIYPLIYPRGDIGWDMNMSHAAERATNQFLVDAYTRVEGCRLQYIRFNQKNLRADSYSGLMDYLENAAGQRNLNAGNVIVLPSTFLGSPRAMHQLYLDAMAVVAKYGRPDCFLTFTCNPRWKEITDNLLPQQTTKDRPDLVCRVFRCKLYALKKEIKQDCVDVIEFQKRGLPHCHMLLRFTPEFKLRNADDIDALICARIPDIETEPELYEIIKTNMIHGPCGALNPQCPCMVDGSCSKNYPKCFNDRTLLNVDGFPHYYRPDDGRTVRVRNFDLDNRSVVPYNPYLSKRFNAHINLEACVSIKAVKYLYKYIYKGHDSAHIELAERIDHDEIKTFLDALYVSAPEACWRLFSFNMHTQTHIITRLAVHLRNFQRVYFQPGGEEGTIERAQNKDTVLAAWFKLNQEDPTARTILYPDISNNYVFVKATSKWKVRQREPNDQENRQAADRIRPLLNPQQINISDTVLDSLAVNDIGTSKVFFLDGPGGTGKTFTHNYIIKEARARSFCVATSSWTGIAATLLDGGKTCHNLFKLPVPVNDCCSCNVKPTSKHADFLRSRHIFIFDEASMISKYALEAIDRMLRDISNSDVAFAGKVILLGGDFRQTLPVVKRGTAAQVVETCLKSSYIWALVRTFYLHTNMRTGPEKQEFSEFLLRLGAGALPVKPDDPFKGCIQIPDECVLPENSDLVPHIFNFQNDNDQSTKVILTPTNNEALEINEKILRYLGGDVRTYFSFDSVMVDTQEKVDLYPLEFLHSLTPSGMPKHRLNLKEGSIITLVRNLSLKDGLCNGTRLKVCRLQNNLIDAEIRSGFSAGAEL
ncbi:uncharacterized protein [Clytia hemisphaerica]|uniref:uncharacterized protein n=1 Tax=Clytia hemisphaerica TaxID=252671 RepID=UPI0034D54683